MSLQIIKNVNVDFYDKEYILINAKQLDKQSRFLYVTCYNRGELYRLNGGEHSAYLRYKKADGNSVFNYCDINTKGIIIVELTEQMLSVDGICYADLLIVDKGTAKVNANNGIITGIDSTSILSTMTICIDVVETAIENSEVESSYEYNGLNDALERVEADYTNVILASKSWAVGNTGIRENENYDNAKYYASLASDSQKSAASSANQASNYASNASSSASSASASATRAAASEANAKTSEDKALVSENNAKTSENNALTYASQSSTSASNAKTSESNASTYASNASVSATNASKSEANAKTSENNANTYATNAEASATNAKASESSVEANANSASESAANALASENNASASEVNAENYMNEAKGYADSAKNSMDSASTSENSASEHASNSEYYYNKISEIIDGLNGTFLPMGTIEFSELAILVENDTVKTGFLYNISNDFITDDTFKEGAGLSYPSGTNVYYTADNFWDCLSGSYVVGIKGDNEESYRKGNVNITAENVGAIPTTDIATVDEIKDYLGIV